MFIDDEDQTSRLRARRLLAQIRIAAIAAMAFVVTLIGLTATAHAQVHPLSQTVVGTDRGLLMTVMLASFIGMATVCGAFWRRGYKDVVNAERERRGH